MPLVSPDTVMGLPGPVAVAPPGDAVTVKEVIAAPPSAAGGKKLTLACAFPGVAVTDRGGPGTPGATVWMLTGAEVAVLVPPPFVAETAARIVAPESDAPGE